MAFSLLTIIYLIGSITFIVGLKMLSKPITAKSGNLIAAAGMALAIFGTIFLYRDENGIKLGNYGWIFTALLLGSLIGTLAAKRVKMTAMPEMVSLFNGMGGACAMLISVMEFNHLIDTSVQVSQADLPRLYLQHAKVSHLQILIVVLAMVIGAVSFSGSVIAFGKLNGQIKDYTFKAQQKVNIVLLLGLVAYVAFFCAVVPVDLENLPNNLITIDRAVAQTAFWQFHIYLFYGIIALALVYGVMFVLPIGGADMPVVISLLNSFTGVAAALGGFLYDNQVMLTGGILVGAAGTLLTILMCKAMNRSLLNVLVGAFGGNNSKDSAAVTGGHYKEITLNDTAVVMSYASKVMIVPGYGLAVAQAQHACHELEMILEAKGVRVAYAIHPVAGRMPGHMNVLLAEADVSYERLLEMEQANEDFKQTDVVLVLGANDVVNPAAKTDPSSPIYGMPILEVEEAKTVIVNKRSMKPGYAGIENNLFFQPKTYMLFGDAKSVLQNLITEIKSL